MIKRFILWITGWKEVTIFLLQDAIERSGLHSARIYTKGFMLRVLYKNKEVKFCINPTNEWGELLPVNNAELFEYYKAEIAGLKDVR